MDKTITFAIPAYNSEAFLDKCLTSFINDELLSRIEVIIVNDGSTDNTKAVAEKYTSQYPDTFRLINKENGGHGSAINAASKKAAGKYFKVIDADDWVETKNLLRFIEQLENTEADVILNNYQTYDIRNGDTKRWSSFVPEYGRCYSLKDVIENWKWMDRCLSFHGMTYKTEFYQKRGMELSEKVFYEDHEYATVPCCQADTILPLDLIVYIYRIGDVTQSVSAQNQLKRIHHTETVILRLMRYLKEETISPEGREYVEIKAAALIMSYYKTALLQNPDRREGRRQAKDINTKVKELQKSVLSKTQKKYYCFVLFNIFHLSADLFDSILQSKIYNKLRGNYEFR